MDLHRDDHCSGTFVKDGVSDPFLGKSDTDRACHGTAVPSGELFHLYHPRGGNSSYQSKDDARNMREEFIKVCCMSPDELKSYILK